LSHKHLPTLYVSTFYVGQLKSFILGGSPPPERPEILSEQLSHEHLPALWVSTLYVKQFKSYFWRSHFGGSLPRRAPKFCPNNCLTNDFLLCELQFSMRSSSKVLFLGSHFV